MSPAPVESSVCRVPIWQPNPGARRASLGTMRIRFPTLRRATWRQRFVAIARQADGLAILAGAGPEVAPHRPSGPRAPAAIRVRFAPLRSH
jgi:hypothetical protein